MIALNVTSVSFFLFLMPGTSLFVFHFMTRENFGGTTTEEGHKAFFGGKEHIYEHGVGFLVHKDIVNTVMGCRPVSSRLITVRLWAVPFNITVVQAYAPTSDYDDNEIEEFYDQLQNVIDQTPKKDILVVLGDSSPSSPCKTVGAPSIVKMFIQVLGV